MNSFLTVTTREIHARRMVFVAAAFAGVIPLVAPVLGAPAANSVELRAFTAMLLSLSFGTAVAILLGATVIVRDLSEQRLAFYFTRPLSALTIWGGKFLAAFLIVIATLTLCALPTLVANGGVAELTHSSFLGVGSNAVLFVLLIIGTLVLLSHAVSSAIRSHSRWLVADVALIAAVGFVFWWSSRTLLLAGYWGTEGWGFKIPNPTWAIAGLCFALLVATYRQVSVGRTDLIRAHGALSTTFWTLSGACALLLFALALWVSSASTASLGAVEGGTFAPRGDWAFIAGRLRHRGEAKGLFLWNSVSGRSLKLPLTSAGTFFSGDGSRAAWLEAQGSSKTPEATYELMTVDLASSPLHAVHTKITFPSRWIRCELSPAGRRLAALENGVLTVYDVNSGKSLAGARLPEAEKAESVSLTFTGENRVRVFRSFTNAKSPDWPYLLEFDVPSRTLVTTGRVVLESSPHVLSMVSSPSGDRFLVADGHKRSLRDGRTGAMLAPLEDGPRFMAMVFVRGEGVVAASVHGRVASLDTYSPAGAWQKKISLGSAEMVHLSGQREDGTVLAFLLTSRDLEGWKNASLIAVDLQTGNITHLAKGLRPFSWWSDSTVATQTMLFLDGNGALVRLDPKGAVKVLLGGTH